MMEAPAKADALEIEAGAKRRLADEYDAAQERGEIKAANNAKTTSNAEAVSVEDIGLTHKDIRDAEKVDPGRTVERIARMLAAGGELSTADRLAMADALRSLTLPEPRHAQRDKLLIECRSRFYGGHSDHAAAQNLCASWRRYETTSWIRERAADACPSRHVGTEREFFWLMLRACPRSLSADRVRRIFGRLS